MDVQFNGANCLTFNAKGVRIVVDDNLEQLGSKTVTKPEDVALFTNSTESGSPATRLFDGPGEYEVSEVSIVGIPARSHIDESNLVTATMFKLIIGDQNILITGHIYPELSEGQLEKIGIVDMLFVPVGGNGYTTDPIGAMKLIKSIEPKIVVPTHYADKSLNYPVPQQDLDNALKEMGMEPKDKVAKLRLNKPTELSDVTQLIILEKS